MGGLEQGALWQKEKINPDMYVCPFVEYFILLLPIERK